MRLIDAVAYRKVLEEEKDYQLEHCFDSLKVRIGLEIAEADLGDMPTVDAVPVVRCRECKLHTSSAFYPDRLFCQEHGRYVDPDGYCYLG